MTDTILDERDRRGEWSPGIIQMEGFIYHWPPHYKAAHALHHKNANTGPWSGIAMHPVEHILNFFTVMLCWVLPSHPFHTFALLQRLTIGPVWSHSGFEKIKFPHFTLSIGDLRYHYLHHRLFDVNYGLALEPWDKWFGSLHDGSPEVDAAMRKRRRQLAERRKNLHD